MDGQQHQKTKDVRFWVFDQDVPTLLGIPAFKKLGLWVGAEEDGPVECLISHGKNKVPLPICDASDESDSALRLVTVSTDVQLSVA